MEVMEVLEVISKLQPHSRLLWITTTAAIWIKSHGTTTQHRLLILI